MKKAPIKLKTCSSNDSPQAFSTAAFIKNNKKRRLPDAFYPSWELELLSSFIAIFILWILPDWIMGVNDLLSSKFEIDVNSSWIDIGHKLVVYGFIISFITRIIWLAMVWKWNSHKSSKGDEMFRSRTAKHIVLKSTRTQKLAITMDRVAEVLFFISSIILFITLLSYLIVVLGSLLNHSIFKTHVLPEI